MIDQVGKQEQCSGRNCLLILGIPENRNEKTDDLCIGTINEHLELPITEADVKHTHRIGKPRDAGQKSRPIIVKLVRYNYRKNIFNRKQKLKGKNIVITVSLRGTRMKKLNEARELLKMFGHLMGKFYLRMDQEIHAYFTIHSFINLI